MSARRCGVWIDNAEAIVVRFSDDGEPDLRRIDSGVPPRAKSRGGMMDRKGRVGWASHKKRDHRRGNQMTRFFDTVWEEVREADEIAIVGPGLAKKGVETSIRAHPDHPRIVAAETKGRVTDPQLVALFRERFAELDRN